MSRTEVVCWGGTGNAEAMARAVAKDAPNKKSQVPLMTAS